MRIILHQKENSQVVAILKFWKVYGKIYIFILIELCIKRDPFAHLKEK